MDKRYVKNNKIIFKVTAAKLIYIQIKLLWFNIGYYLKKW